MLGTPNENEHDTPGSLACHLHRPVQITSVSLHGLFVSGLGWILEFEHINGSNFCQFNIEFALGGSSPQLDVQKMAFVKVGVAVVAVLEEIRVGGRGELPVVTCDPELKVSERRGAYRALC